MSSLDTLKVERATLRTRATKLVSKMQPTVIELLDRSDLEVNIKKVSSYIDNLLRLDHEINSKLRESESVNDMLELEDVCEDYEDKLRRLHFTFKTRINAHNEIQNQNESSTQHLGSVMGVNRTRLNLPNIDLPTFYADTAKDKLSCRSFIDTLELMWENYQLNSVEKYALLLKQCEKRAKAMVESLTIANRSYETAKNILLAAFDEVVPQQYSLVKQLTELKLVTNGDAYVYYSSFMKLIETLKEEKVGSDLIIQYFIWRGLPVSMQDHLITVSQQSYPDLTEIKKHFLAASSRFEAHKGKPIREVEISAHAVSLKTENSNFSGNKHNSKVSNYNAKLKKSPCCFCMSTSHKNSKCELYNSVQAKRDRIIELNLCSKCLKTSDHTESQCKFRFNSSCFYCSKFHWTFLCPAHSGINSKYSTSTTRNSEEKSSNKPSL